MHPGYQNRTGRSRNVFKGFSVDPIIIIILLNTAVYLVSVFKANQILTNMALSPLLFTQRPWTILSAMFVHVDFWHLFGNMITLYFFGRVVYRMMGGWRFLVIYFIGGLIGNLLYAWIGQNMSIAYGASGAVYALAGALVVLMPKMKVTMWFILPMPLWVVVLVFFVAWSFIPGIAWQAHIGGLLVGAIAGLIFRRQMRHIIYQ
jgi:membrane associated rhomboid family serine protease